MIPRKKQHKRAYVAPRVVDLGAMEVMTAGCLGLCLDGEGGGLYGAQP